MKLWPGPQEETTSPPLSVNPRSGANLLPSTTTIAWSAVLLSCSLSLSFLIRANVLFGSFAGDWHYDEGVYFGAALRLSHGVLPYRDFVLVHPPGIAVLLAPIAFLDHFIGSDGALAVARLVTTAVVAVNVLLAGLLVKPAGRWAVGIASFSLALWPFATDQIDYVSQEQYIVFFGLLAMYLLFGRTERPSNPRVVAAGACLGMACSIKLWGIIPTIAVMGIYVVLERRRLIVLLAGIAATVEVVCLPFFLTAPGAFIRDVFESQLSRKPPAGNSPITLASWLLANTGFNDYFNTRVISSSTALAILLTLVFAVLLVVTYGLRWRRRGQSDWAILVVALVVVIFMLFLWSKQYSVTRADYVTVGFMAPLLGICGGRSMTWLVERTSTVTIGRIRTSTVTQGAAVAVFLVATLFLVVRIGALLTQEANLAYNPQSTIDASIPSGACVMSDYAESLIVANRFTPAASGCPAEIDNYGLYLVFDNGNEPHLPSPAEPYSSQFTAMWQLWLSQSQYVVESFAFSDFIPWSSSSIASFNRSYVQVGHSLLTVPTVPNAGPYYSTIWNTWVYQDKY